MIFTLDRIENKTIAVLIDDDGKKYDVPISMLSEMKIGGVYVPDDKGYIYNEKETLKRRNTNSEKFKKLLDKAKNKN